MNRSDVDIRKHTHKSRFSNLGQACPTIQEATRGVNLLVSHYKSVRAESKFDAFYADVLEQCVGLTEEPCLPRYRRRPRRLDDGEHPHNYQVPKDRYRHIYFEVLELVYGEIESRFDQADFRIMQSLENLLLKAANGEVLKPEQSLLAYLERDIDTEKFAIQLHMITDMIKNAFQNHPIKSVTNVRTIAEGMSQSEMFKRMLGEVHKVLKLYFTFPVTTATAERSFSSLKRIKTFLRNSMTQSRLNNLFILYIHPTRTEDLDLSQIAKEFISVNTRRLNYFGKM